MGTTWLQPMMLTAAVGYQSDGHGFTHTYTHTNHVCKNNPHRLHTLCGRTRHRAADRACVHHLSCCSENSMPQSLKILFEVLSCALPQLSAATHKRGGGALRFRHPLKHNIPHVRKKETTSPQLTSSLPPVIARKMTQLSLERSSTHSKHAHPFPVTLRPLPGLPNGLSPGTSAHLAGKTSPLGLVGGQDSAAKSFSLPSSKRRWVGVEREARGLANEYFTPPRNNIRVQDNALHGASGERSNRLCMIREHATCEVRPETSSNLQQSQQGPHYSFETRNPLGDQVRRGRCFLSALESYHDAYP